MEKYNLSLVDKVVNPKPISKIPVKGNEYRMVRIAFDLFRLDGDKKEELWMVQADDDGQEYLVRTYNLPEEEEKIVNCSWNVDIDKKYENLTVSYKHIPIVRLATKNYGAKNEEDSKLLHKLIFKKLADKDFIISVINELPETKKKSLSESGIFKNTEYDFFIEKDGKLFEKIYKENFNSISKENALKLIELEKKLSIK